MTHPEIPLTGMADTNVLLDASGPPSEWRDWSERALRPFLERGPLMINPIIYAELAAGYARREDLDGAFPAGTFHREDLPWEAAFLAGHAFLSYRRRGGTRTSPLPDFFIGAHAQVNGYFLITRDTRRYRAYFPRVRLVSPEQG